MPVSHPMRSKTIVKNNLHSLGWIHVTAFYSDWLLALLVSVAICQSNYLFDTQLKTTLGVLNLIIIEVWDIKPKFSIKTRDTSFLKNFVSFMYSPATIKEWIYRFVESCLDKPAQWKKMKFNV